MGRKKGHWHGWNMTDLKTYLGLVGVPKPERELEEVRKQRLIPQKPKASKNDEQEEKDGEEIQSTSITEFQPPRLKWNFLPTLEESEKGVTKQPTTSIQKNVRSPPSLLRSSMQVPMKQRKAIDSDKLKKIGGLLKRQAKVIEAERTLQSKFMRGLADAMGYSTSDKPQKKSPSFIESAMNSRDRVCDEDSDNGGMEYDEDEDDDEDGSTFYDDSDDLD